MFKVNLIVMYSNVIGLYLIAFHLVHVLTRGS